MFRFLSRHRTQSKKLLERWGLVCRLLLSLVLAGVVTLNCAAKNTLVWTGGTSADWNTAANWSPQIVPTSVDDVQIGLITFTNQPVVSGTAQCATLSFGNRQAITLTVNAAASLTVAGTLTLQHSEDNLVPNATLSGSGSLTCSTILVGDLTFSKVVLTKNAVFTSTVATLNVTGNVAITSITSDLLSGGLGHNNALFSLQGGQMNVSGQIRLVNMLPAYLSGALTTSVPNARFRIDLTSGLSPHLKLLKGTSVQIMDTNWDSSDYVNNLGGTGNSIVEYGGADQVINTAATVGFDTAPQPYQNLLISGTGTKSTESTSGDNLIVGGYLYVQQATLDLQSNHASLVVSGDFNNSATTKLSAATFKGDNFTNSGQLLTATDIISFLGNNQLLVDATANGTSLNNVAMQTGTKTVSAGTYNIPTGGAWNVADENTVLAISPDAQLTFSADASNQSTLTFTTAAGQQGQMMAARTNNSLSAPGKLNASAAKLAPVQGGTASVKASALASSSKAGSKLASAKTLQVSHGKMTPVAKVPSPPKTAVTQLDDTQSLQLKMSGAGEETTLVKFKDKANTKYMPSEDAFYLGKSGSDIALASYSSDDKRLSVNISALPKQATTTRLWVYAAKTGHYNLGIAALNNIPAGYHIWLVDKFSGSKTDLRVNKNYAFAIDKNKQQSYGDRFELLITLN